MKLLVVYNPFSRNNKIEKNKKLIINQLSKKYEVIDFYKTEGQRSITKYIINHISNYDLLIVSGGDGTINEAISGVVEANFNVAVYIIPSGTINDLSHVLGYTKSIKKSLNNILNNTFVKMDICKINDKYFSYAAACGKYSDVSYKAKGIIKKIFGPLAYVFCGVKEFFNYTKLDLKITSNDNIVNGSYYVIFLLNTKRVAGFYIDKNKNIKLNDGLIDLVLINKSKITWPRLLRFFLLGNKAKRGIDIISSNHFLIESKEELDINTDGELAFKASKIEIDVLKEKVNFSVSQKIKNKYFQK